jgi:hypothetical protein
MIAGVLGEESLLALSIQPSALFIDPDLFPLATINIPGFLLAQLLVEGEFAQDDLVYDAFITIDTLGLFPPLLVDADAIFAFSKNVTARALAPSRYADVDTFYTPAICNLVLGPALFVDIDQVAVPTLTQTVPLSIFVDVDIIRNPIIEIGGINVLGPQAISDGDTFYTISLARLLSPSTVIDGDIFLPPGRGNILLPGAVADADAFFAPLTANQLRPSKVSDVDSFVGPLIGTPGRMGLVIDQDVIFAAAIARAPLAPPLFVDADVFFTHVIDAPVVHPNDPVVDFIDTFYAPFVTIGQELDPHLWIDLDNILSIPSVAIGQVMVGAFTVDADTVPAATATIGPVTLLPSAIIDPDTFFAPLITVGQKARALSASRAGLGSVIVSDDGSGKTRIVTQIGAVT